MKTKFLFIFALAAILCSCDTERSLNEKEHYFLFIFRFADEANKELIITTPTPQGTYSGEHYLGVVDGLYNYPKRYRNEPYFGRERWLENPEKYSYDICELATEEKLLALHDGYYTYFPYTSIIGNDQCVVRDGRWENLCDGNPLDLPILGSANDLYKDIRLFKIYSLKKLTGKSVKKMTIEDIENAINKTIDEGQLEKHSVKLNGMWASLE